MEFYFDFASPYAYFASGRIDAIAARHGRRVARTARRLGLPFVLPEGFPMIALAPSRVYYWLLDQDEALAKDFAGAVFDAYFGRGRDMSVVAAVATVAAGLGDQGAATTAT